MFGDMLSAVADACWPLLGRQLRAASEHRMSTFCTQKHVIFEPKSKGIVEQNKPMAKTSRTNGADISQPSRMNAGKSNIIGRGLHRVKRYASTYHILGFGENLVAKVKMY